MKICKIFIFVFLLFRFIDGSVSAENKDFTYESRKMQIHAALLLPESKYNLLVTSANDSAAENQKCTICDQINMIHNGTNPFFVKELNTGYVVLGAHHHFYGYTLFFCKEHNTELFLLDKEFRTEFLEEMSIVAEAVSNAFGAEKMNYELLGNSASHLHWHLFPRRTGDLDGYGNNGEGPVWWYPMEKMYGDDNYWPEGEELELMKERLLTELDKLLCVK